MKFQLVLQFPASSLKNFDQLIQMEDLLIEKLGSHSEVDGHDFGAEEANIFIYTDEPQRTFEATRAILSKHTSLLHARIAYRKVDGDDYIVLWPKGETKFAVR